MNWPTYIFYRFCLALIRIYKSLEFQILKLATPLIKNKAESVLENLGVVLHYPSYPENKKTDNGNKWETTTKQKNASKYSKIIHLKVHKDIWFARLANKGMLATGETYMEKMWDFCNDIEDLSEFAQRMLENDISDYYYNPWNKFLEWVELCAFNLQSIERVFQVGKVHYDLGNDLFERMLDPRMQYTCAYWKDAKNLNDAQLAKMELIARKLDLKPGMRVLDIGCGWGTLCKYLAEKYHVQCVGITIAEKGAEYGRKICNGLPVEIRIQDYREVYEKFDRIVSVGMFEHVGFRNYREFFKVANRCLSDDGIFLLHSIVRNHTKIHRVEPWANKYIFPNGHLPHAEEIVVALKDLFVIEDVHNFGPDYAKTLFCWRENFIKGWPDIESKYGGETFYRMWTLYLSFARSLFMARRLQLWQVVLSKDGLKREYRAIREFDGKGGRGLARHPVRKGRTSQFDSGGGIMERQGVKKLGVLRYILHKPDHN